MGDLNPFSSPKDYSEMLTKIAFGTFVVALFATYVARKQVPEIDAALKPYDLKAKVFELEIAIGYVLPAAAVAIISRAIKLHDRISDLLGIRRRFDIAEILLPLARGAGVPVDADKEARIEKARGSLMVSCFYAYASSTAEKAVIDKHLIVRALDQWSWYWIVVEAAVVAAILAIILTVGGQVGLAVGIVAVGALAVPVALHFLRKQCAEYAHREVDAILQDATRKDSVSKAFCAI